MGLRSCELTQDWRTFEEKYDRINNTCEKLFRVDLSKEEREADLDSFRRLMEIVKGNQMVHDTSY